MTDFDWPQKRIVVTGGGGFLGSYVVRKLKERGCTQIFVPRSCDYDLVKEKNVVRLYQDFTPDIVIHLAAVVGGIGANRENPGRYFYENLMMGTQLLHQGYLNNIEKFVAIGTICAYPKHCPIPFKETDIWNGYPEETNAPYGLAKKMMLVQSQAYRDQYNFNSIYLLPVNLYGPSDNFDPTSSHVIPALIKKFIEAKEANRPFVEAWGDGTPTREFLYAEDAAEGIVLATESYNRPDPINLGTGFEISIKDLTELIGKLADYEGTIQWDPSKPNGQPRRKLCTESAYREFGFKAATTFEEGLYNTIKWYKENR